MGYGSAARDILLLLWLCPLSGCTLSVCVIAPETDPDLTEPFPDEEREISRLYTQIAKRNRIGADVAVPQPIDEEDTWAYVDWIDGEDRAQIYFSTTLRQRVRSCAKIDSDHVTAFILAHELGHASNRHKRQSREYEADADYWGGRYMRPLGAPLSELILAMSTLPESYGYPTRAERNEEVASGWFEGRPSPGQAFNFTAVSQAVADLIAGFESGITTEKITSKMQALAKELTTWQQIDESSPVSYPLLLARLQAGWDKPGEVRRLCQLLMADLNQICKDLYG